MGILANAHIIYHLIYNSDIYHTPPVHSNIPNETSIKIIIQRVAPYDQIMKSYSTHFGNVV